MITICILFIFQDSVRLLAVEACASISSVLLREDIEQLIAPTLTNAAKVSMYTGFELEMF